MTGSWSLDLEMLVHKTGVIRFIEKPFRFEDLEQIVTEVLGQGPGSSIFIASDRQVDKTYGGEQNQTERGNGI